MVDEPRHGATSEQGKVGPEARKTVVERADRRLLELLVCPVTKTSLDYDEARQELISRKARLAFPIRRGVPHMLPSEARPLED